MTEENLSQKMAENVSKQPVDLNVNKLQSDLAMTIKGVAGHEISMHTWDRLMQSIGMLFVKTFNPEAFDKLLERQQKIEDAQKESPIIGVTGRA